MTSNTMAVKAILHPQEIETHYIIPTLRRYFATHLKEQGMKQKDIASLLGVSSATISQYTSTKRGHKISFPEEVEKEIKIASQKITDQFSYFQQTQQLLKIIRKTNTLCQIHRLFSEIPSLCDPEIMGCHATEQMAKE